MKLTGAQIMIKCLEKEGVEVLFGLPGGAILPTFDASTRRSSPWAEWEPTPPRLFPP